MYITGVRITFGPVTFPLRHVIRVGDRCMFGCRRHSSRSKNSGGKHHDSTPTAMSSHDRVFPPRRRYGARTVPALVPERGGIEMDVLKRESQMGFCPNCHVGVVGVPRFGHRPRPGRTAAGRRGESGISWENPPPILEPGRGNEASSSPDHSSHRRSL